MTLRRRTYLSEATYQRDVKVRKTAEEFYKALVKFLRNRSDELVPRKTEGGYSVHAMEFWKHPKARNFGVIFIPQKEKLHGFEMAGGLGKAGNIDVLLFPIMMGPYDKRHLVTRLDRNFVVHEMIHFLDPAYGKTGDIRRYHRGDKTLDTKKYYNEPGEWNAFWQEGAAKAERFLRTNLLKVQERHRKKMRETYFGDGSLKAVRDRVKKFWDANFLENMSKKTARKFDKRLARLWKQWKDEGLL